MTIGQGSGENKTAQALQQALHHPLLDSASLDNAQGIIANFTSGSLLTLSEIQEALEELQSEAGGQAEIVLGVTNDERMGDRVQIFLVITGLGAPSLEETMSNLKKDAQIPEKKHIPIKETSPTFSQALETRSPVAIEYSTLEPSFAAQSLDLPAFLRRRTRTDN